MPIPLWASYSPQERTEIKVPSVSNSPPLAPILFIGGTHGDEPEGVWLAEAFLNALLTLDRRRSHRIPLRSSTSLVAKPLQDWVLIPCLNPEGFIKKERTNSAGVDLNRNFPSSDWTADYKEPRYFPGTQPASEPEVQGVLRAIEVFRPRLIIHFHSWKPCVVYTGELAKPIAEVLGRCSGYPFHEDIGYPTPGSLGQYGWLDQQIPVVCIEEQEGAPRDHVWPRFQRALMGLIT